MPCSSMYPIFIPIHITKKNPSLWAKVRVGVQILAKRTRACNVRVAENRVCECACV